MKPKTDHSFKIENDYEFYCYLKHFLPDGYKIVSLPQKAYYSEWHYCYQIYKRNKLFKEVKGNYKKLRGGELAKLARNILSKTGRRS